MVMFLTIKARNADDLSVIMHQLSGFDEFHEAQEPYQRPAPNVATFYPRVSAEVRGRVQEVLDRIDPTLVQKAVITDMDNTTCDTTILTVAPDLSINETFHFDGDDNQEGAARKKLDELGIDLPVRFTP